MIPDNTPKEKAIQLIEKMKMKNNAFDKMQQKHCATMCVDEIIADFRGYRLKIYINLNLNLLISWKKN